MHCVPQGKIIQLTPSTTWLIFWNRPRTPQAERSRYVDFMIANDSYPDQNLPQTYSRIKNFCVICVIVWTFCPSIRLTCTFLYSTLLTFPDYLLFIPPIIDNCALLSFRFTSRWRVPTPGIPDLTSRGISYFRFPSSSPEVTDCIRDSSFLQPEHIFCHIRTSQVRISSTLSRIIINILSSRTVWGTIMTAQMPLHPELFDSSSKSTKFTRNVLSLTPLILDVPALLLNFNHLPIINCTKTLLRMKP